MSPPWNEWLMSHTLRPSRRVCPSCGCAYPVEDFAGELCRRCTRKRNDELISGVRK